MAQVLKRCNCKNKSKCSHSWTVRWWRDDRQHEKSFKLNRPAADAYAKTIEAEKVTGAKTYGNPPAPVTFKDYVPGWLDTITRPGTRLIYETVMRVHLTPALGNRTLADVAADTEGVEALIWSLSAGVQRPALTALMAMLKHAKRGKRITSHDLHDIALEPRARRADPTWPIADQFTVLTGKMGEELAPAVWIMRGTGLRPGECLALAKSDFAGSQVRVQRQQLRTGGTGPLKARAEGFHRDIPVPGYVREIVAAMPDGPLFSVTTREFNKAFRTAADAAGLAGFRPHDLRHWFASVTLGNGVPITHVAKWLGHASVNTTFSTYAHFIPNSFDSAVDVLDQEYKFWKNAA